MDSLSIQLQDALLSKSFAMQCNNIMRAQVQMSHVKKENTYCDCTRAVAVSVQHRAAEKHQTQPSVIQ